MWSPLLVQRNRLFTSMPLGNKAGTEIRTRLRLRSTVRGANNRLDVDAIVSYDRGTNAAIPLQGAHPAAYNIPAWHPTDGQGGTFHRQTDVHFCLCMSPKSIDRTIAVMCCRCACHQRGLSRACTPQ